MATAHLNGIEIYFERSGTGPPLLFFNGSGSSIESSGPLLAPFRARFDVLVHDQRGLGRSAVPPSPFEMADYAADAAALLDHVGWDTCRVVGVSFGGMVAQEFAVTWPERVERLALVCTSPGGPAPSYPLHRLGEYPPDERARMAVGLMDSRFTQDWLAEHPVDRMLVDAMAQRSQVTKTPEQLRGEAEQLGARSRLDVTGRLGAVTCPTFVASGRFDGIAPPANGRLIAELVPDAEFHEYEGGHAFWVQDRGALPAILEFLAG